MKFAENDLIIPVVVIALLAIVVAFYLLNKSKLKTQSIVIRVIAVLLLSVAVLSPYYENVSNFARATLLMDISESLNEITGEELYNQIRSFSGENFEIGLVPFAGGADIAVGELQSSPEFRSVKSKYESLNIGQTNIESGLLKAIALEAENIILVSDGFENQGSSENTLALLKQSGKRIFPFIPDESKAQTQKFELVKLHAPLVAAADKSVEIRASIKNGTNKSQSGMLEIKHDGKVIQKKTVTVPPGTEVVLKAESDPSKEGIKEVQAILTPVDPKLSSSSKIVFISGEKREKVLLINGSSQDEFLLSNTLNSQSYRLVSMTSPGSSTNIPALSEFSTVILNNVNISQLPANLPARLESYVKGGGSAIMIGGNQSFGLGGYKGTAVETMLPVEMVPPQTAQKRLNVAVSLVLDKSRSMAVDDRMYYAKEAAGAVVRALKDDDLVEIIGFDSAPFVVVKLSPLAQVRSTALDRVNRLFPAGRTNLLPALHEAKRSFAKVQAGRKHMIVLTDGKLPEAGAYYSEMIGQLRADGVTLSTVLVGSESDTRQLREMAQQGGGSFHQTVSPQSLAKIFIDDIRVSTGERTLKEATEFSVRKGDGKIESTTIEAFPPLRGYVQTKPKPGSNLELITYDGTKAEPLLVSWRYGKGKSIAFTSDANGRWSSFWASWSKFATFWSEIIDSLRPSSGMPGEQIRFDLRYFVERGKLNLDLVIFSEDARGAPIATLILPGNKELNVSFEQLTQGRFKAEVDDIIAGKYELRTSIGGKDLTPVAFYLPGDLFGEKTGEGFNIEFLSKLALLSGGKINPAREDLMTKESRVTSRIELEYPLIALAVILLLLDILKRELGFKWPGIFKGRKRKLVARVR